MKQTKIAEFFDEYRWLSNFYPVKVILDEMVFPSVENAYQAAKTLDFSLRQKFLSVGPGDSKRIGKQIPVRPNWDDVKEQIMYDLVMQKFCQHPLQNWLFLTGDAELVEGNTWGDTYWGVCRGQGSNRMGKILMMIRTHLRTVHEALSKTAPKKSSFKEK